MDLLQNTQCLIGATSNLTCSAPTQIMRSSDDLGRAMRICSDHQRSSALTITVPPPRIPDFMQGWEACTKVWAAWLDSEEARQQREYEAEIERQRQFVNDIAGKLK